MARTRRDPRTKEEFLDRMLSYDFNGDIRALGIEPATVQRLGPNALRLKFPDSGTVFDVTIHRPREFAQVKAEGRSFSGQRQAPEPAPAPQKRKRRSPAEIAADKAAKAERRAARQAQGATA